MSFNVGALVESVESSEAFTGIGKLLDINDAAETATIVFFESPIRHQIRPVQTKLSSLQRATIHDETNVYYLNREANSWRRVRYNRRRHDDGRHLVIIRTGEPMYVDEEDIYVLNLLDEAAIKPFEYLECRFTDFPYFSHKRELFVKSYIEQRAACKSISSILSSSVAIVPHQVAVVRRVLTDTNKKYLLADEVGLGKTIEACLILREHILQDGDRAQALISVPEALKIQWQEELTNRFYLGDLLGNKIILCTHDQMAALIDYYEPTMVVIDEAHQITSWAIDKELGKESDFGIVANATHQAEIALILSGTPSSGNEPNYNAMLHLIAPDSYALSDEGQKKFKKKVEEREALGGMYQALVVENDNDTLTELVKEIREFFPDDNNLLGYIDVVRPLVDSEQSEEGEERARAITELREYVGDNFRLHQRMLRNRRTDPRIANLFPGLAGLSIVKWNVDGYSRSLDQVLDGFREEFLRKAKVPKCINSENFREWLELYLTSPNLIAQRSERELCFEGLLSNEVGLLKTLIECGKQEQIEKDNCLRELLVNWLDKNERGKAIVFCGEEFVADSAFQKLHDFFGDVIERHDDSSIPRFSEGNEGVRVLVVDERGEDGLNLHGGKKLIVHYSIPLSFIRIEQRNGRVNRYSASIPASPVQSAVLVPDSNSLYRKWIQVLEDIGIFDDSVASLQYILQENIESAWVEVIDKGSEALDSLGKELEGEDGLLARESQKVKDQEELNSMNAEVAQAFNFANELEDADEKAEMYAKNMLLWITGALNFQQLDISFDNAYRFRYRRDDDRGGDTLVDEKSFVEKCITGIDKAESTKSNIVTALMSSDRQISSHGRQIYPMRFGQPFVDSLYDLSRSDTRGTSSAIIRHMKKIKLPEPKMYFSCFWLVTGEYSSCNAMERRLADEKFPPRTYKYWFNSDGNQVGNGQIKTSLLEPPYRSKARENGGGVVYVDTAITEEYWRALEEYFPVEEWPELVAQIEETAYSVVNEEVNQGRNANESVRYVLESVAVVVIVGSNQ